MYTLWFAGERVTPWMTDRVSISVLNRILTILFGAIMFGPTAPGYGSVHTTVGARVDAADVPVVSTPLLDWQPARKTMRRQKPYARIKPP